MRKVAVLGAGGFIGTNLCLRLLDRGWRVRALSRHFAPSAPWDGVERLQGAIDDEALLRRAVDGCDLVVHLAVGVTPQSSTDAVEDDIRTILLPTLRLAELCRGQGARLLFVSSGGTVYGVPRIVPTPEAAPCDPINPYGAINLAIEKYLGASAHLGGLDHRVLRLANPYGPHQRAHKGQGVVAAFLAAAAAGRPIEIWGDGSVVRDFIYIDDVLDAVERAAAHAGPARVFNIGSGHGTSLRAVADLVERVTGRPLQRLQRQGRKVDVPASVLDVSLAGSELGWSAGTSLAGGIEHSWRWWQSRAESA